MAVGASGGLLKKSKRGGGGASRAKRRTTEKRVNFVVGASSSGSLSPSRVVGAKRQRSSPVKSSTAPQPGLTSAKRRSVAGGLSRHRSSSMF